MDSLFTPLRLKLLLLLGAVCIIIYLISSYGFIDITVMGTGTQINYTLFNKSGAQLSQTKTTSHHFRKLLRRGTYQAYVQTGETSDYRILHIGGFIRKTNYTAKPILQRSREFVGNNPNFCMHYSQDLLYSYDCSEPGNLTVHLPATINTPTTTLSEDGSSSYLPLKGFVDITGKPKALLTYAQDEDQSVGLYDIDSKLNASNPILLKGIKVADTDQVISYQAGFLIYSNSLSKIKYFSSPISTPISIATRRSLPKTSHPVGLSVSGHTIGALFNSATGNDTDDDGDSSDQGSQDSQPIGQSEFHTYGDNSATYIFNKLYTSGGLCGHNDLCLINGGTLDVYKILSGKAQYIFSIQDVQKTFSLGTSMLIITSSKVIALREESLTGSIQYSYAQNSYCGGDQAINGYVLCVLNNKGDKTALFVNTSLPDLDNIDVKINKLLGDPNIDTVSIYRNYIYISPNLGSPVYNNVTNDRDYDPIIEKSADTSIKALIKRLHIDESRYTIINPLE